MIKNHNYYTNSINISAALLSKGIRLINFHKKNGIITFVFDNPNTCKEIEKLWLIDQLEVSAYSYSQELRRLKNIVHGGSYDT